MRPDAAEKIEGFLRALRAGAGPVLLLDYDGTLAPFHLDRFQARPWAGVRELLEEIRQQGRTRMAVVSGRPAEEIRPLLGLEPPLEIWGLHGVERVRPDGRRELERIAPETLEELERLGARLENESLDGLLERKPNALAVHWRGVAPERAAEIERKTRALFEPAAGRGGLKLLQFEAGLELRAGRNKGGAVEALLAEELARGAGAPAVAYLGDDFTDEEAFRVVNRAAGAHLSVLVRTEWRETEADAWVKPPEELLGLLRGWVAALRGYAADAVAPEGAVRTDGLPA